MTTEIIPDKLPSEEGYKRQWIDFMHKLHSFSITQGWEEGRFEGEFLGFLLHRKVDTFTVSELMYPPNHTFDKPTHNVVSRINHYFRRASKWPSNTVDEAHSRETTRFDQMHKYLSMDKEYRDKPLSVLSYELHQAYEDKPDVKKPLFAQDVTHPHFIFPLLTGVMLGIFLSVIYFLK